MGPYHHQSPCLRLQASAVDPAATASKQEFIKQVFNQQVGIWDDDESLPLPDDLLLSSTKVQPCFWNPLSKAHLHPQSKATVWTWWRFICVPDPRLHDPRGGFPSAVLWDWISWAKASNGYPVFGIKGKDVQLPWQPTWFVTIASTDGNWPLTIWVELSLLITEPFNCDATMSDCLDYIGATLFQYLVV